MRSLALVSVTRSDKAAPARRAEAAARQTREQLEDEDLLAT